jgi:adenylosuccinate lyase
VIPRYSRPAMSEVWSDGARLGRWLEVELAVARQQTREGLIPRKEGRALIQKGEGLRPLFRGNPSDPDSRVAHTIAEIHEIEATLKHDVLAFTTFCAERIGDPARFLHFGLTSTDVVDTALALTVRDAGEKLLGGVDRVVAELKRLALRYKALPCVGRTHGMHAEPTVFGLKFLGFHQEMLRSRERLERALDGVAYGKLSGAVGANLHFPPEFEAKVLKALGLKRELVSTQVLPRDRMAEVFSAIAILGASIERIVTEIRHLSRTEVGEVQEGFSKKQKGSSAMPHKKNPVGSENLTGCARLLRSYLLPALENVPLWHERDISHSSVERVILPDAFILSDYALDRLAGLLSGLVVQEQRVRANLEASGGAILSGHVLLALVKAGVSREEAYRWIQSATHEALDRSRDQERADWVKILFEEAGVRERIKPKDVASLLSEKRVISAAARIYREALASPRRRAR